MGLFGLTGWRLRKPLLWRWLWAASAVLAWLVVALMLLSGAVVSILAVNDPSQWRFAWMAAGMFLLLLPLASGLSTYAFHAKTIW